MARTELADLEAIPHYLKAELDSWTEAGKPELQPDYKAPEVKAAVREAQEADRKRHENSRLGEGVGFSLLK